MADAMNRAIELHNIHPVIDRIFVFEQAKEAYRRQQSQAHVGKVVIPILVSRHGAAGRSMPNRHGKTDLA